MSEQPKENTQEFYDRYNAWNMKELMDQLKAKRPELFTEEEQ